jgi:hypothetical protein
VGAFRPLLAGPSGQEQEPEHIDNERDSEGPGDDLEGKHPLTSSVHKLERTLAGVYEPMPPPTRLRMALTEKPGIGPALVTIARAAQRWHTVGQG